jgi:hypothetical protein
MASEIRSCIPLESEETQYNNIVGRVGGKIEKPRPTTNLHYSNIYTRNSIDNHINISEITGYILYTG